MNFESDIATKSSLTEELTSDRNTSLSPIDFAVEDVAGPSAITNKSSANKKSVEMEDCSDTEVEVSEESEDENDENDKENRNATKSQLSPIHEKNIEAETNLKRKIADLEKDDDSKKEVPTIF